MPLFSKAHKLALLLRRRSYRRALGFGVAAGIEHEQVLLGMRCNTVVDIGANRGQFSVVARYAFPKARIYAFEPLSGPVETFRRVFASDSQTVLYPHALGSRRATDVIHVSRRDDSSSLYPIGEAQTDLYPDSAESHTETVRVERLDDIIAPEDIERPSLLKLDVQGYELEALKGAPRVLRHFDFVYCECAFRELYAGQPLAPAVIQFLSGFGLLLAGIHNPGYAPDGSAVQADLLFRSAVPRESALLEAVEARV